MNDDEQKRINALNDAYLNEEPPVQNFTWEGYEAWKKQQWRGHEETKQTSQENEPC